MVGHDVCIMLWDKLATEVRSRRKELGLSQLEVSRRGGPSVETLRAIENDRAGRLTPRLRRALERTLEWESGVVDVILEGGNAAKLNDPREELVVAHHDEQPIGVDVDDAEGVTESSPQASDRFALAKRVVSMKATFAKHRDQIEPDAREDLINEVMRSAREAEQAIISLLPWLDDAERGEAIGLLAELRAEV